VPLTHQLEVRRDVACERGPAAGLRLEDRERIALALGGKHHRVGDAEPARHLGVVDLAGEAEARAEAARLHLAPDLLAQQSAAGEQEHRVGVLGQHARRRRDQIPHPLLRAHAGERADHRLVGVDRERAHEHAVALSRSETPCVDHVADGHGPGDPHPLEHQAQVVRHRHEAVRGAQPRDQLRSLGRRVEAMLETRQRRAASQPGSAASSASQNASRSPLAASTPMLRA
jgi:hypothetical protein